ncbi:MAG: transcriptional repressor [Chloroflexi bacterium]|nr:transcriptional repressor [Chloroflexota bacterium]
MSRGATAAARTGSAHRAAPADWAAIPERIRRSGLRWTARRQVVLDALAATRGHITGSGLVAACRAIDPATTPSTVYRTLDVLEAIGAIAHSHGLDGREEFHAGPARDHGHLICSACGSEQELAAPDAAVLLDALRREHGFEASLEHLSISGRCAVCAAGAESSGTSAAEAADASGLQP